MTDAINPEYYKGEIECIDAIRVALGREGFEGYLRGICIKYLWRCEKKGGIEDLKKAQWYMNRLIEFMEHNLRNRKIR